MMPRHLLPTLVCGVAVLLILVAMLWPGLRRPLIAPFEYVANSMADKVGEEKDFNDERLGIVIQDDLTELDIVRIVMKWQDEDGAWHEMKPVKNNRQRP